MATVLLVGTLDTKGKEYAYLADRIREHGVDVLLVDAGSSASRSPTPTSPARRCCRGGSADVEALAEARDRARRSRRCPAVRPGSCCGSMPRAGFDAIGALGGTGGTALVTHAMQQLPIGVPKLMVSTVASGDTSPYFGPVDVTMMYSVVDIAGLNSILDGDPGERRRRARGMAKATASPPGEGSR